MSSIAENSTMSTMPHVGSQYHPGQLARGSRDGKGKRMTGKSIDYLKPMPLTPRERVAAKRSTPSLSQLATPENIRWDVGSIRHIRDFSQDTNTPVSAVETIFELPSGTMDSPNSSAHSSFVAELEDTSPIALKSMKPAFPARPKQRSVSDPSTMEFKTTEMTARAVIKVVDETIANIEAANRKLLSRAEAAEKAARALRGQNSTLQLKIDECIQNHRPKTAPSQPSSRTTGFRRQPPTTPTPLSSFNETIDQLVTQRLDQLVTQRPAPRSYKPPPYPPANRHTSHTPSRLILKPFNSDLAPDPFISTPGYASHPRRRSPPLPLLPAHNVDISAPIPGSVMRHEVTYDGCPISSSEWRAKNISLDEARRRAKPLPPLGPMSPSVLRGVVEIGTPRGVDEFGRFREPSPSPEKRRRMMGLGALFKRMGKGTNFV